MIVVLVKDREGQLHTVNAELDAPLMESLKLAGLPVAADCGGCASCGTCHVHINKEWRNRLPEPDLMEEMMLQQSDFFDGDASRLSCQIQVSEDMNGLQLSLAPQD